MHQAPSLGFMLQDWEVQSCLAASLMHEFFTPKFVTRRSFGSKLPKRNDLPNAASLRTRGQAWQSLRAVTESLSCFAGV